ncbi:hypothetical protein, partial [Alistipes putredinis]|uniref:hypothetical protein n=1 Tax=Alistipes putredinis TaxID=28117 RepID=UPI00242BF5E4
AQRYKDMEKISLSQPLFPDKIPPRKTPPEGPVRAKINSKKFPYGRLIARKPDDRTYINLPLP